jgi:hypothetical protein
VIRISLSYVYNLAAKLEPLEQLPQSETPYGDIMLVLFEAKFALDNLDNSLFKPYIRSSWQSFTSLKDSIEAQINHETFERKVSQYEIFTIKQLFQQFKITLLAELQIVNAYFVTQKGGYDTLSLLLWGENCFPAELSGKVPEALFDVREATRSLAYELPIAAGFHVFRVLESVLRKYHSHVTGGIAPLKVRNIGVYLESLRRLKKGDAKVIASIKQIADLHRNPLIHPETVLTVEEAISIMGISRSAVAAMLVEIPTIMPTTAIPQLPHTQSTVS